MIYTKRAHLSRYLGQSENLDKAIHFLLNNDLACLAKGKNIIDGEQVFVNRFNYQTIPEEDAAWEGHIEYVDIHVLLGGCEKIGVSNTAALIETTRKTEDDFVGYIGDVQAWLPMSTDDVLIVYPEDAHMVKVCNGNSCFVEKVCFKVKC